MTGGWEAQRVSAVVPTVGKSPYLGPCLAALRREGESLRDERGAVLEVIVVDQGEASASFAPELADHVVRLPRNLGFAGGTNAGIAAASGELVATVNDDVMVEPGWLSALVLALAEHPEAAAVQGVNLSAGDPRVADSCGLAWNRWWQAVQRGVGAAPPAATADATPVFGVSATAALYRRRNLEAVARDGEIFDPRLVSYYEDTHLACRLRAAGAGALLVPRARALHAGSTTGRTRNRERWRLIYGNRFLVAAELLGGAFWLRLPRMVVRDLRDLVRAGIAADGAKVAGIVAGWARAARRLGSFARRGAPSVDLGVLARLR